ncbi:MAG TPA: hypothetical protein GXX37_05155 [Clostridiaceae bacterium]|nr:hypothetical protein [Clostridiaceae bacterium]
MKHKIIALCVFFTLAVISITGCNIDKMNIVLKSKVNIENAKIHLNENIAKEQNADGNILKEQDINANQEISNNQEQNIDTSQEQNINTNHEDVSDSNQEEVFKLYIKNENEIELYSDIDESYCLITRFSKEEWGTWNIWGWLKGSKTGNEISIPAENTTAMVGSGTDWEYVLRVSAINKSPLYFSGGNHGNEELVDITFIKYPNEEITELIPGQIIDIKDLKVIENTTLHINEEGIKNYADVKREYTFRPDSIELSSTFVFKRDVFVGTSYVSMFPIKKEYGRYFKFDNIDSVYQTDPQGKTKSKPGEAYYLGKVKALSTVFWGDINPEYKFRAWIKDVEMVNNFENELKTFVWDLNIYENKLYYSKYDIKNTTVVKAGTVWKNFQGWEFIKE